MSEAKRRVLRTLLTSEFTVLSRLLARIASGHYSSRDYSADSLRQALTSHRTTGNRRRQAATLRSVGTAECRVGQAAQARQSWAQAAAIFEELGDRTEAAEVRAEQESSGLS